MMLRRTLLPSVTMGRTPLVTTRAGALVQQQRWTHYPVKRLMGVPLTRHVEKNIRQSPRKLNQIAKMVRRMWVPEAKTQLKFLNKRHAPTFVGAIERAAHKAGLLHELVPEELEIERAFVTPAPFVKRLKIRAKGMSGTIRKRSGHIVIVLAKMNFDNYIDAAKSKRSKNKWQARKDEARRQRLRVLGEFADTPPLNAGAKQIVI
mmetsp:Transcript_6282/g.19678  ORF Transcript_6282/g.19678 Transcript_6282/m.19678 type:complete len:205 (-) Transcript_6282:196-810(-)